MKQWIVFVAIVVVIGAIVFTKFAALKNNGTVVNPIFPTPTSTVVQATKRALFVPYWTLDGKVIPAGYDTAVYFGITADASGIDTTEDGYKDIGKFVQSVRSHQKTLLSVELLDQNIDEKLLHDIVFQQKIINESIAIAKQNHFDGIVLDLEYKALAFDEVIASVNNFSSKFSKAVQGNTLFFYQTLYGDSIYRLRPYDIATIGKISNGVFILAYDFHKADGNPGPNFPLNQLSDEAYSFSQMIKDFSEKIPANKITIVFGMFGYDWRVNNKGQSVGQAKSFTTNQLLQKFIPHCSCTIVQNKALETEITYKDTQSQQHTVWFEDLTSVERKNEILNQKGISSTAFWAYSYF